MSEDEFNIPLTFQEIHIILSALKELVDYLGNYAMIVPDKETSLHDKILDYAIKYEKKQREMKI